VDGGSTLPAAPSQKHAPPPTPPHVQISCGTSQHVVGVNSADMIYRYVPSRNDWDQLPGALRCVSVGADGCIWGTNASQQIYRWNGMGSWDMMPGAAVQGESGGGGGGRGAA
jgi:hypothetical protein